MHGIKMPQRREDLQANKLWQRASSRAWCDCTPRRIFADETLYLKLFSTWWEAAEPAPTTYRRRRRISRAMVHRPGLGFNFIFSHNIFEPHCIAVTRDSLAMAFLARAKVINRMTIALFSAAFHEARRDFASYWFTELFYWRDILREPLHFADAGALYTSSHYWEDKVLVASILY